MLPKFNLAAAVLALALFATAQQQGWNLFEDVARSGDGRSNSSRASHK
jgi:hypothetical protein